MNSLEALYLLCANERFGVPSITQAEQSLLNIIKKDLELLQMLREKEVDISHLAFLCRCCGYESGCNCYNEIPANKTITLEEVEMIMEWLSNGCRWSI